MEMKAGGYLDTGTDLKNPNFAEMAQAMGILGIRVDDSAEVEPALRRAFAHDGPVLVDAVCGQAGTRHAAQDRARAGQGFSLFLLKAIINGRGDEVMELVQTNLRR